MRIIRVRHKGQTFFAVLGDGAVISLSKEDGPDGPIPIKEVSLVPLITPSKIICLTLNYRKRAEEIGAPLPTRPDFVLRPSSSLAGNGQALQIPPGVDVLYPSASLAIVIGRPCRRISVQEAPQHIFGYTCANDASISNGIDGWSATAGRACDAICPVGPWLETEPPNQGELSVRCRVNNDLLQDGMTTDMVFYPAEIVSYLSQRMTLASGDVILTGSPAGTPAVHPGDTVQIEIPGVGALSNRIVPSYSS